MLKWCMAYQKLGGRHLANTIIAEQKVHRKGGVIHPVGTGLLLMVKRSRFNSVTSDRIPAH